MAKMCPRCGEKIGFFSGKFIGTEYVCNSCYEIYNKELNKLEEIESGIDSVDKEQDGHNWTRIADAQAKAGKYEPWSWGKKEK